MDRCDWPPRVRHAHFAINTCCLFTISFIVLLDASSCNSLPLALPLLSLEPQAMQQEGCRTDERSRAHSARAVRVELLREHLGLLKEVGCGCLSI